MRTDDAIKFFGSGTAMCDALGIHRMNWSHWGYWVPEKYARTLNEKHPELKINEEIYNGKVKDLIIAGHVFKEMTDTSSSRRLEVVMKAGVDVLAISDGAIVKLNDFENTKFGKLERNDVFKKNRIYSTNSGVKDIKDIIVEPQKNVEFHGIKLFVPLNVTHIAVDGFGNVVCSNEEMKILSDDSLVWVADASYLICKINVGKNLDWKKSQVEVK
jgi:hypothetical protein